MKKKYLDHKTIAANTIKEQYILISNAFQHDNDFLDFNKLDECLRKINTIEIDKELKKVDRTMYILSQSKKLFEAERRRRKYDALLNNAEEEINMKEEIRPSTKRGKC